MQVYIELSILENFCMDYTLLYSAKLIAKNSAGWARVAAGSALGAAFAVVFPLFTLPVWASVAIKVLSGAVICLAGGKFCSVKGYAKFFALFLALSALLAGGLYGIFSLAGLSYIPSSGYILSPVPVGIPLFGGLMVFVAARFIRAKLGAKPRAEVTLRVYLGEKSVALSGFFDSGNKLYHRGRPVCVLPKQAAQKLIDVSGIKTEINIHTVAGGKKIKVFTADRLEIDLPQGKKCRSGVCVGVSAAYITSAVLHPDIMED